MQNNKGEYEPEEPTDEDVYNATYRFFPDSPKPEEGLDGFVIATQRDVASRIATPNFAHLEDSEEEINTRVRDYINIAADTQHWGIYIKRHVLPKFLPADPELLDALQAPLIADREGQAEKARSEGQLAARTNLAEAEKREITARAEGRKAEEIAKAEAQATAAPNMKKTIEEIGGGLGTVVDPVSKLHPLAQVAAVLMSTPSGIDLMDAAGERLRPSSSRGTRTQEPRTATKP